MKRLVMLLFALMALNTLSAQMELMPMPEDPEVRKGVLPNGMTYYIRHNEKPKGQADFYILHNVGAIQEEDSQQGLAHFLEHMAFNGTKNLEGKTLINYLEKIGVSFGRNLNAATGWDQTTYQITDVPVARESVIDSALLILHDWSHFIALQPAEIDSERGVIMEELRTRDGAQWRSTIEMIKALGKGTRYEHRNLIGYLDGLKGFDHKALEDFYQTWYRPEYQAVIVVGDIDVNTIEKKIQDLMADIPASPKKAKKKAEITVPDNEKPIVSIYTDAEMPNSRAVIFIKGEALPPEINGSVNGQMILAMDAFATQIANERLSEIAMKPDAPFLRAGMNIGKIGLIPTLRTVQFVVVTQDGKLNEGIEAVLTEMERIRRFGFTAGEFERARADILRASERQYNNREDRTNDWFVQRYISNYTENSPIPDAETEWQIDQMLINQINVDLVNMYIKQIITPDNQVYFVTAPKREGLATPKQEEILALRDMVAKAEMEAYADTSVSESLLDTSDLAGSPIVKASLNQAFGTFVWELANGLKVVIKPTTFKADEVLIAARARQGLSVLTDEEYRMGELMSAFNSMSGVGNFSATDLRKQLAGKSAAVSTSVDNYYSEMQGSGSPKDFETMLQLLYLNFTQPRFDENDYNNLMRMLRAQLENLRTNPDYVMMERFSDVAYGHNFRRQELTIEDLDKFQFDKLPEIYAKLYPCADGFTFYIVGNIDVTKIRPLIEKYIGSLPTSGKPCNYVDDKAYPVKGLVVEDFKTPMQQPKVSVRYRFTGKLPISIKNQLTLQLLSEALNSRYLVSIREEKGGTYGVHVSSRMERIPVQTYRMDIQFDTNEEMADELREIVMQEIKEIAANGPKSEDIEKTREFLTKEWKNRLEKNGPWLSYLQAYYGNGMNYIDEYQKVLQTLTGNDVQKMAQKMLKENNLVQVIMRPEAENKAE